MLCIEKVISVNQCASILRWVAICASLIALITFFCDRSIQYNWTIKVAELERKSLEERIERGESIIGTERVALSRPVTAVRHLHNGAFLIAVFGFFGRMLLLLDKRSMWGARSDRLLVLLFGLLVGCVTFLGLTE
jgi:hypothetical protein